MDNFDVATATARRCARKLLKKDVSPVIVADAFIAQALAAWASGTGRYDDAINAVVAWTLIRDAR